MKLRAKRKWKLRSENSPGLPVHVRAPTSSQQPGRGSLPAPKGHLASSPPVSRAVTHPPQLSISRPAAGDSAQADSAEGHLGGFPVWQFRTKLRSTFMHRFHADCFELLWANAKEHDDRVTGPESVELCEKPPNSFPQRLGPLTGIGCCQHLEVGHANRCVVQPRHFPWHFSDDV